MIIDIHGNAVTQPDLYSAKTHIFGEGNWALSTQRPTDVDITRCAAWNVQFLDEVGTDVQLIAPRPYQLVFSNAPTKLIRRWTALYNDVIAAQCALHPSRLRQLVALPQAAAELPASWVDELDHWVSQGCVGVVVNPDPGEGDGKTLGLGDEYWYPVWERLVALDLPALIVSGVQRFDREGYSAHFITESAIAVLSLVENPRLFTDFPTLKLIIGFGAGSIPYQIDRWRARRWRQPHLEDFDVALRRLYFDTVVHAPAALTMLFDVCGTDRCLFGTQRPSAASVDDPRTGHRVDDLKPKVAATPGLSADDLAAIFEGNARRVFHA